MSRVDGLTLRNDLAAELWDTSTTGKARVMKWINDGIIDISSQIDLISLKKKGRKNLTASAEQQNLNLAQPTAPTLTLLAGGALTDGSTYRAIITYYESSTGRESIRGLPSNIISATSTSKALGISSIPVSSDPDVTSRRIYISKDSGDYYFSADDSFLLD